jgi:hypothetical protein
MVKIRFIPMPGPYRNRRIFGEMLPDRPVQFRHPRAWAETARQTETSASIVRNSPRAPPRRSHGDGGRFSTILRQSRGLPAISGGDAARRSAGPAPIPSRHREDYCRRSRLAAISIDISRSPDSKYAPIRFAIAPNSQRSGRPRKSRYPPSRPAPGGGARGPAAGQAGVGSDHVGSDQASCDSYNTVAMNPRQYGCSGIFSQSGT